MSSASNFECPSTPTNRVIARLADLKITENVPPTCDSSINTGFSSEMTNLPKSTKSMLLKAFAAHHSSGKLPSEHNVPRRRTNRSKVLTELSDNDPVARASEAVESYFLQYGSKDGRGKTSDRTLSSLCTNQSSGLPDPPTYEKILSEYEPKEANISKTIQKQLAKQLFDYWPVYLKEGFNILLYGLGSKRGLLDTFRQRYLSNYNCLVVPGYDLSVNIRQILSSLCDELLQISEKSQNITGQMRLITDLLSRPEASNSPVYIVVHNIDGPGLRNTKAQAILAHLASIENIHLIASVDHPNMPIIWSNNELARFRWIWEDCTNLADYSVEASYANSTLLQNLLGGLISDTAGGLGLGESGTMLASLRQVAASLTQNARDIFRMVAEHQLDSPLKESHDDRVGMPLEELYWRCRDAFLTNSEATLRTQLTEFRDHKLIKIRKGPDGTELLHIPMDDNSLRKFVQNFDTFC
ncbi:unnamed protein product [Calicophoron daubneyi]|uniref:Origin recognition complex subunit 2 n=1 Tax=Calicophoron daubneyi TaxID=300641 RepID=A0AAV2SYL3_CALDB